MKEPGYGLFVIIKEIWPAVILALFGGFVELMTRTENTKVSVKFIISTFVTAGFIGMIVSLILYEINMPLSLKGAIIGASGASARSLLGVVQKWGSSFVKKILGDKDGL